MEETFIDFQNACRICLNKMENMISIFEEIFAPDLISYKYMIQECASIQVLNDDVLPKKICYKCSEQLQLSYKLKIKCLVSEKIMKNWIEKANINVKTEVNEETVEGDSKIDDNLEVYDHDSLVNSKIEIIVKEEHVEEPETIELNLIDADNNANTTKFNCEWCNKPFFTQIDHLSHIETVHIKDSIHERDLCAESLRSQLELEQHLRTHKKQRVKKKLYSKTKGYHCTYCKKTFPFKSKLEQHMISHSGESQHLCTYCGKSFRSGSSLRVHLRTHTNEKPYCCNICGFKSVYPLRDHLISHSNEKKFECEICKKTYARRNTLKRHVLTHSDERNFVCDICGKQFTFKHKLREHQYTHTGERKYICTYCNKPFNRGDNLRVHLRIHTGDKPFVCSRCGRAFSAKHVLNSHLKTHIESPE